MTPGSATAHEQAAEALAAGHKTCGRCGTWRPLEDFRVTTRSLDGRSGTCRDCYNRRTRELLRAKKLPPPPLDPDEDDCAGLVPRYRPAASAVDVSPCPGCSASTSGDGRLIHDRACVFRASRRTR